jgi:predicted SnoaL-like aldol condensation-catalyzing enzyme
MSLEANKALVKSFWQDVFNEGSSEVADKLFAPDHTMDHPYLSEERRGPDPMLGFVWLSHKISPNLKAVVEDEIAEGEKVVTRWTARGTLADELRDTDGDDEVAVSGIGVFLITDGKIKETWLRFEADPSETQGPVPKRAFRQWLREPTGTVWDRLFATRSIKPEFAMRWCCLFYRRCCEPSPPDRR